MLVRDATPRDLDAIFAIYDHWVVTSTATFDLTPLDGAQRAAWFARFGAADPLLVADDGGRIAGYAYHVPYRPMPAYAATKETTVYVAPDAVGRGVATALYETLIERARRAGVHCLVAVIADPNPASEALHRRCGFERVGTLREAGSKFSRLVDTTFWQRNLTG